MKIIASRSQYYFSEKKMFTGANSHSSELFFSKLMC